MAKRSGPHKVPSSEIAHGLPRTVLANISQAAASAATAKGASTTPTKRIATRSSTARPKEATKPSTTLRNSSSPFSQTATSVGASLCATPIFATKFRNALLWTKRSLADEIGNARPDSRPVFIGTAAAAVAAATAFNKGTLSSCDCTLGPTLVTTVPAIMAATLDPVTISSSPAADSSTSSAFFFVSWGFALLPRRLAGESRSSSNASRGEQSCCSRPSSRSSAASAA
mmetsp:Transcript_100599/g.288854  ORF Transcript_100599/g.288854 Transcript_100599/m.288854 type:complete len:228 (+) Transcript_100599:1504-2187(+)